MAGFNDEQWMTAYEKMWLIRGVEERCEQLALEGRVRGSMHLYTGQEAVAVGATAALVPGDQISFTYRSHGWALARGISPAAVFGEIFGREIGCSGGWGGSKHLGDWSLGILPSNAIVGANLPLSNGTALAAKLMNTGAISLAACGDGAMNQGVVHEAMVMAQVLQLPIVFVCENNQYSEMTPAHEFRPVAAEVDRAAGWGMRAHQVDGMDVEAVFECVLDAAQAAREGRGPTFIEAVTYRYCGHMTGDMQRYRSSEEVAEARLRDPLTLAAQRMLVQGFGQDELSEIAGLAKETVQSEEAAAWASPEPSVSAITLAEFALLDTTDSGSAL